MGDAVNLGSRLEGITKEYGVASSLVQKLAKKCQISLLVNSIRSRSKAKILPLLFMNH